MQARELIGKKVTNIFISFSSEQGWLDTADLFIELDNTIVIGIPFTGKDEVEIRDLKKSAKSIFKDSNKMKFINWFRKVVFGYSPIAYPEINNLLNKIITDILWYEDDDTHGYIELNNGYVFTIMAMAPHGTGATGLRYFQNIELLKAQRGEDINKLT
jgi:hypothetical protein